MNFYLRNESRSKAYATTYIIIVENTLFGHGFDKLVLALLYGEATKFK